VATLVTGATGLVGSWLIKELLARGDQVVALVRDDDPRSELVVSGDYSRCTIASGALEDVDVVERALAQNDVHTVFHLGAQTQVVAARKQPLDTWESNLRGTYCLLEAVRRQRAGMRAVVVASSDKAYGDSAVLPYTEETALLGTFPYDASKAAAEIVARSYAVSYAIPVAVARCGNIYGGGDLNWARIVPGTIRSLLQRERPIIRSDGKMIRDYIYVKDVVQAYLMLADTACDATAPAFNFSCEQPMSVLDVVHAVARAIGERGLEPDVRNQATHEIRAQHLSAGKARERLKWAPKYSLEAALPETVAWYRRHFEVTA
jgi:CDP-glucose 4,6-dehydratase